MSTLKRYNGTNWETIGGSITGDTLPIGSEIDYTGSSVPAGWEEVADYSTSEVNTGKKWIDGRDIYRKVVTGTRSTSQTNISYSNWNVNEFIAVNPIIYNSDGSYVYTQPYYASSTDQWRCYIDANAKNIVLNCGSSYPGSSGNYKIIVEYTKTTD